MNIYIYKMVIDNGGAPCVENNLLSLAICKPIIRRKAKIGDYIIGVGGKNLHENLIYVAKITDKLIAGQYYKNPIYKNRKDCIYQYQITTNKYKRKSTALYHHAKENIKTDLGKNYTQVNVLLSTDFIYYGNKASQTLLSKHNLITFVKTIARGHRVQYSLNLVNRLKLLIDSALKEKNKFQNMKPKQSIKKYSSCNKGCFYKSSIKKKIC